MALLKRSFLLAMAIYIVINIHIILAVKPLNYVEKLPDKFPPKYEYNYYVTNRQTQASQGHNEVRNGDDTRGNYFVNLPKGESKTSVNYIADAWGFHPVIRYSSQGAHHRVSGHFALGLHAVERLNDTNLNTSEMFVNQLSKKFDTPIAQATFPTAQIANPSKSPIHHLRTEIQPISNTYASNQPYQAENTNIPSENIKQGIVFNMPGESQFQFKDIEKNSGIFRHLHIPVNYQYAQQQQPISYYNQPALNKINPILQAVQQSNQQPKFIFIEENQQLAPQVKAETYIKHSETDISNSENLNSEILQTLSQDFGSHGETFLQHGSLKQVQKESQNEVATDNQRQAKLEADIERVNERSQEGPFESPIVVGEQQITFLANNESDTIVVQQKTNHSPLVFENYQQPQKQFNLQILTDANAQPVSDQLLKESFESVKIFNADTSSNNFQYQVEDQARLDSTEAPSRQFLKKFKPNYQIQSTSLQSNIVTSTSRTMSIHSVSEVVCCKNKSISNCCKSKVVNDIDVTQRPITNPIIPVQAGKVTHENLENCLNENSAVVQDTRPLIYGERTVVTSTSLPVVNHHHRIQLVEQPIAVEKQHLTEIVHHPIYIEKEVIKGVEVPVEKPVYIKAPPEIFDHLYYVKSPPETKIVEKVVDRPIYIQSPPEIKVEQQKVIVENLAIKEVAVPYEKTVYVKILTETKFVQPVIQKPVYIEKIVEKPTIQTVEKLVDRPIHIEKYIDRPYPVPYAVGIPYDNPIFVKPDFHVYVKAVPDKHKLFDFDSLFGFLSKKKEVKHIFVPSSHQHQLKQLNQHQLVASTFTSKKSPVLDYSHYANNQLNPIKPFYGVPSTQPINTGYIYPHSSAATIPASWVGDSLEAQQTQTMLQNSVPLYHLDGYIGPTPLSEDYWATNGVSNKEGVTFRRNVEKGRSFRIEYGGFFPKISPSLEINEDGTPCKKKEIT